MPTLPPYTDNQDLDAWTWEITTEVNNLAPPGFASRRPAPSASTDDGALGEIRFDANYMYLCVDVSGTLTWKRLALTTF